MLLHSRQKRKVICSCCLVGAFAAELVEGAGEAMLLLVSWGRLAGNAKSVERRRFYVVVCRGDDR